MRYILWWSLFLIPFNIGIIEDKTLTIEKQRNVQILFDVSLSMAAMDIQPSRFHAAREALIHLVEQLNGYNISIIPYARIPFILVPFSSNTHAISHTISQMQLADFVPTDDFKWTAIWDALLLWLDNLSTLWDKKPWVILLLTDWDNNAGTDPEISIQTANRLWIPIFTLAIGEDNQWIWESLQWQAVYATIDIELLKKISQDTWWQFFRVFSLRDFKEIFSLIAQAIQNTEQKRIVYNYFYINSILIYMAIIWWLYLAYIEIWWIIHYKNIQGKQKK